MLRKPSKGAPAFRWYPSTDGGDHINIYSNGETELGRKLSHFAKVSFIHPIYGPFDSMEGFWYYARNGFQDNRLRYLVGNEAKNYGKLLPAMWYKEFKEDVMAANYQKVIQSDDLMELLKASELPFTHYYVWRKDGIERIVPARDHDWLCNGFEEIRTAVKEGRATETWLKANKRYQAMRQS